MTDTRVPIRLCSTESESWDMIWRWTWFSREAWWPSSRQEAEPGLSGLVTLLRQRGVRSVLDAACGLGRKTILLAERGFEVEGADASAVAVTYAPRLAAEKGLTMVSAAQGHPAAEMVGLCREPVRGTARCLAAAPLCGKENCGA